MNCRPKFLHRVHSAIASLLSRSIPGQNHLSWSLSCIWSHPKCPFSSCIFIARLKPFVCETHSTCVTRSFAFVHICQSLPFSIAKLRALCLALWWVQMSGMSLFVSASTMSLSHGSSVNCSCRLSNSSACPDVVTCIMSLLIPLLASQSGQTDQSAPSLSLLGPFALAHFLLIASATTLVTPGRCCMSMMFLHTIDSSHLACVTLCFLLSRTSHSAWQSVSISIGDPYIMVSKSSRENFSVVNSTMKGLYFSLLGDVLFEQNAKRCHSFHIFPWLSVISNSWDNIPPKPVLLPSVTTWKTLPSYCGGRRIGSDVTATFRVRMLSS